MVADFANIASQTGGHSASETGKCGRDFRRHPDEHR